MTVAEHVLDPELERTLLEYAGEWVAVTETRLLAHGDDPKAVIDAARRLGVEDPIVYRVPDNEAGANFY
jgi:hypothetical protein